MAISGLGVAMATGGVVLVYAGLQDQNPLAALRSLATGNVSPIKGGTFAEATTSAVNTNTMAIGAGPFPQLPAAALAFAGDQYSQAQRWDNGFSDCSSFVGKAFKALGITPPGASTTWDYLGWTQLSGISASQAGAGDLVINGGHIIICTGPGTAIGQENPHRNVATGAVSDLMSGTGSYGYYRYTGNQNPGYHPPPAATATGAGATQRHHGEN